MCWALDAPPRPGIHLSRRFLSPNAAMPDLKLKTVTRTQGNNQPLKDGSVRPRTFAFDFEEVNPIIAAFRRWGGGRECDVGEGATPPSTGPRASGKRFPGGPVFLVRPS